MDLRLPDDDFVPTGEPLDTPEGYRTHVVDTMTRGHSRAQSLKRKGDRLAVLTIVLALLSSAGGFMIAVADSAVLGVVPGVLGATAGAVAAWVRRSQYDHLAAETKILVSALQRELRRFDAHSGVYEDLPDLTPENNANLRFTLFVERCEDASDSAQGWSDQRLSATTP